MNTSDTLSLVFRDPSTIRTGGDFTKTTIAVLYRSSGYVSNQLCCSPEYTWVTTDLTKLKSLETSPTCMSQKGPPELRSTSHRNGLHICNHFSHITCRCSSSSLCPELSILWLLQFFQLLMQICLPFQPVNKQTKRGIILENKTQDFLPYDMSSHL
jgi:hypothetical protein